MILGSKTNFVEFFFSYFVYILKSKAKVQLIVQVYDEF